MAKVFIKKRYFFILVTILLISLILNIVLYMHNKDYTYRVGKNSYTNIENIKVKSDKNLDIINKALEVSKISNEELLVLYGNYSNISDSLIELWDDYAFYNNRGEVKLKRQKIDTTSILENEVYSRISAYIENTLVEIMSTDKEELILRGKDLKDFKAMKDLGTNLDDTFKRIVKEKGLEYLDGKEREDKVVKNKYWIDFLKDINNISSHYIDYDFTKEISSSRTIR